MIAGHSLLLLVVTAALSFLGPALEPDPLLVLDAGGWNQEDKILKKGIQVPLTYASALNEGPGRVRAALL